MLNYGYVFWLRYSFSVCLFLSTLYLNNIDYFKCKLITASHCKFHTLVINIINFLQYIDWKILFLWIFQYKICFDLNYFTAEINVIKMLVTLTFHSSFLQISSYLNNCRFFPSLRLSFINYFCRYLFYIFFVLLYYNDAFRFWAKRWMYWFEIDVIFYQCLHFFVNYWNSKVLFRSFKSRIFKKFNISTNHQQ